jgi:DNA-binding LytR/AlgR family response regulator
VNRARAAALVVDDEVSARNEVAFLLRSAFGVGHVETADGAGEAFRRIEQRPYDVVFTDVRMPGMDGIELANVLRQFATPPSIVFVTAHEEYAVRAFEVDACDYVLKPVTRARLASALERALDRGPARGTPSGGNGAGRSSGARSGGFPVVDDPSATIPVETGGRTRFVSRSDVRWVEAQGDYVRLHMADGETHLVRMPISRLAGMWADFGFIRIHRGYLVPFKHVTEFSATSGNHTVTVAGQSLPVSRRHVRDLRDRILRAGWRT